MKKKKEAAAKAAAAAAEKKKKTDELMKLLLGGGNEQAKRRRLAEVRRLAEGDLDVAKCTQAFLDKDTKKIEECKVWGKAEKEANDAAEKKAREEAEA